MDAAFNVKVRADTGQATSAIRDVNTALGQTTQQAGAAAVASTRVADSMAQAAAASGKTTSSQNDFIARLQDQVATLAKGEAELLKYRAAQAGVSAEAAPLILQLQNIKAALAAKAAAEADATAKAREQAAALQAQAAAQKQFLASLQDRVATQTMKPDELLRYRAAQLGVGDQAEKLIAQLGKQGQAGQVSAAQTAAAMRMLPAQLTDVTTQLAGGANPLLVLLQQGGQVKDSFGGIAPAARAIGGAVTSALTPAAVLLGVTGVAAAALAVAYNQGAAEADAYAKGIILTGNAAGVTTGQLGTLARNVASTTGTVGAAADALAQLAAAPAIDSSGLEKFAQAAVLLERTTGQAVSETVGQFSELGKAPLQAALKLNETTNFLTIGVYSQIRALTEQGRTAEAAALAQQAYADASISRAQQLEGRLGTLERGWLAVKDGAKAAWDAMLDVGRPSDSLDQQIAAAEKKVNQLAALVAKGGRKGWFGESLGDGTDQDLALARGELFTLQQERDAQALASKQQADAAALVKARNTFDDAGKAYLTAKEKLELELKNIDSTGAAAGATPQEIAQRKAAARFAFDQQQRDAQSALTLARAKAGQDAELLQADQAQQRLEGLRLQGLVSERNAAEQASQIELDRLASQRRVIEAQIALEKDRPVKAGEPGAEAAKAAKLAELNAQLAANQARAGFVPQQLQFKLTGLQENDPNFDPLGDAMRKADSGLDAYEERRYRKAEQSAERLKESRERATVALIQDGETRARAELAIEERRLREELDLQAFGDDRRRQAEDDLAAYLVARNDEIAERFKPGWQRLVDGWSDTTRLMREANDEMLQQLVKGGEDAFVSLVRTGKVNLKSLSDDLINTALRTRYREMVGSAAGKDGLSSIAGFLGLSPMKAAPKEGDKDFMGPLQDMGAAAEDAATRLQGAADAGALLNAQSALASTGLGKLAGGLMSGVQAVLSFVASLSAQSAGDGFKSLMSLAGLLGGGMNVAPGGTMTGGVGSLNSSQLALLKSANGNVFGTTAFAAGGSFTNSVVSSPTYFKFAQGGAMRLGLMGEAGPEAIMPLTRSLAGGQGVAALDGRGRQVGVLPIARGPGGRLSVVMGGEAGAASPFARGGAFGRAMAFASGGAFEGAGQLLARAATPAGAGQAGAAGDVRVSLNPTIQIDARTDQAQVRTLVERAMQQVLPQAQRMFFETIRRNSRAAT